MRIEARLEDGELRVSLDETTYKVFEKTFPYSKPLVESTLNTLGKFLLICIAHGEEKITSLGEKLAGLVNERSMATVLEVFDDLGITPEALSKGMELPNSDEIKNALGWDREDG